MGKAAISIAIKDWYKAIELSPGPEQTFYRAGRAISRMQAGQTAEAVAEVEELTKESKWNAEQWYNLACVYALASGQIADKKREYADRAMEMLRQAVTNLLQNAESRHTQPMLDIRSRVDGIGQAIEK